MADSDQAFGSGTLANPSFRVQTVYANSQFPPEAVLISELRFRPDYFYGSPFTTIIADIEISLSTTAASPDTLAPTFASNVGRDALVVVRGPVSISSAFTGPANGPKEFDIILPLARPFFYNPSAGNLLVDVKNFSGSGASLLSGAGDFGDGASRVGATVSGPLDGASGFTDTGADTMRIGYRRTAIIPANNPPPPTPNAVVVPNILATSDAPLGSGSLFNPAYRTQEVYDRSQFPAFTIRIQELRFRPDSFYGQAFSTTIQSLQINLSTTAAVPEALSSFYPDNIGADDTIVFSGAVSISSSFTGPVDGPKDFDIVVPLANPFTYDPAAGNLLVDIRNFSGSGASLLSGSGLYGDGASRVSGSILDLFGFPDIAADAIEIHYLRAGN